MTCEGRRRLLVFGRSSSPCIDEERWEAAGMTDDGGSVLLADGARGKQRRLRSAGDFWWPGNHGRWSEALVGGRWIGMDGGWLGEEAEEETRWAGGGGGRKRWMGQLGSRV